MSNPRLQKRPTLESLAAQMRKLHQRIENIEDMIELRSAVERNGGKPGVCWEQVKRELELE
ncbi:MAG: hypothetical protein JO354_03050 [Verrucomicrobia bacterium]|nr:hypothetical protein [Verrucomicrobiota bacterium]